MSNEQIEEMMAGLRERGGGGRALEEILLLQSLTNLQGTDMNLLPLLLLAGGGRSARSDRFALIVYLILQQQQQAQAVTTTGGVPPQPSNNLLPLLLALGFFGEERELRYPAYRGFRKTGEAERAEETDEA